MAAQGLMAQEPRLFLSLIPSAQAGRIKGKHELAHRNEANECWGSVTDSPGAFPAGIWAVAQLLSPHPPHLSELQAPQHKHTALQVD